MRLTRALVCVLAAGLAAVLLLAAGQQAALAGGSPGTGGFFGSVSCGQSYSPQCVVSAGSGGSAGTVDSTGTGAGGQPAAGTAAGGGAAGGCAGTENKTFGCVPAGCQVTVQTVCEPGRAAWFTWTPAGALPVGRSWPLQSRPRSAGTGGPASRRLRPRVATMPAPAAGACSPSRASRSLSRSRTIGEPAAAAIRSARLVRGEVLPSRQAQDDPDRAGLVGELVGAAGPGGEQAEEAVEAVDRLDGGGRVVDRGRQGPERDVDQQRPTPPGRGQGSGHSFQ
jgi:hypothetical protein